MSFPAYLQYKDSGVEWLGQVPSHWEVIRIGSLFREVAESGEDGLPILTVSIHDGVSDRELDENEVERRITRSEDATTYKAVRPGDLVYNMMRAWQGAFGAVQVEGMVSPAYVVARPVERFATSFVELVLRTPGAVEEMRRFSKGITDFRLRLYWDEFKTMQVGLPPAAEQGAIIAFLDLETGKIDALMAEQEKLIELLKEKRLAVISHAVTKGLNPNVSMKDSGVEWLGDVPAHWDVVPFSHAISFQEGPGILAEDFHDEGVPLIRVSGVQGRWATLDGCNFLDHDKVERRWRHFRLRKGDLLISASASMGMISEVGPEAAGAISYTGIIRLWPRHSSILSEFIRNIMASRYFLTQAEMLRAGATIQHFGPTHLRQMNVLVPPLDEQRAIDDHVEMECRQIDALLEEASRAIDLLKERRSALISAAVTGKIDVRGLAAAETTEAA